MKRKVCSSVLLALLFSSSTQAGFWDEVKGALGIVKSPTPGDSGRDYNSEGLRYYIDKNKVTLTDANGDVVSVIDNGRFYVSTVNINGDAGIVTVKSVGNGGESRYSIRTGHELPTDPRMSVALGASHAGSLADLEFRIKQNKVYVLDTRGSVIRVIDNGRFYVESAYHDKQHDAVVVQSVGNGGRMAYSLSTGSEMMGIIDTSPSGNSGIVPANTSVVSEVQSEAAHPAGGLLWNASSRPEYAAKVEFHQNLVRVFSARGDIIQTINNGRFWVSAAELSPDGKYVLVRSVGNGGFTSYKLTAEGVRFANTSQDFETALSQRIDKLAREHLQLPEYLVQKKNALSNPPTGPNALTKDEFETSSAFRERVARLQREYEATVDLYNQRVLDYKRQVDAHYKNLGDLQAEKKHQAIREAFTAYHGGPKVDAVRYDADTESFYLNVVSEAGNLKRGLAIRDIPPERARELKSKLEEGQPEVLFRINSDSSLSWEKISINAAGQTLAAVAIDLASEEKGIKVVIRPREIAVPDVDVPLAVGTQKISIAIRDDPAIAAKQAEVDQLKRKRAQSVAKAAELKRLEEELALIRQSTPQGYQDDLQPLLTRTPAAKIDKRLHVLAIGINYYAEVPDVPFADRSAKLFAELARKTLGASPENIITLTNQEATSGRLRGRLSTLLGRLTPEDRLMIYFAGHGVPSHDGKQVFLLAQDGGPGSYEESDLQLNTLYEHVSQSRVGQAQLFIDACFSGRSNKDRMILGGTGGVAIVPKHGIRADSRLTVMIAGRAEQLSNQDEAHGHRLFGYHLMRAMLDDGFALPAGELHSKIHDKVRADSLRLGREFEQEPELLGNPAAVLRR